MAQNSASLNFQAASSPSAAPADSPWSIGDENSSGSGFVNYSSPNSSSSNNNNNNNGQMHKRPIMSQQQQQLHHALSPNSSLACNSASSQQQQQQYVHYNKNNGNSGSNNFSAAWSNHSGPNSPWQQQQQQQQMQLLQSASSSSSSQVSLNAWNRGRSAPNLNPLSPHIMQHQRKHQNANQFSMPSSASSMQQQPQGLSLNLTSPSKYRRSTSFPGKNNHHHQMHAAFPMDVGSMIEDQPYMSYQVSGFWHRVQLRFESVGARNGI
jgi:hypothetical protein